MMTTRFQTVVFLLAAIQAVCCSQCNETAVDSPPEVSDSAPLLSDSPAAALQDLPTRIAGAFEAQVAGQFYPAVPDALHRLVSTYIEQATVPPDLVNRDIAGIVSPHAGYEYSGAVAGEAWAAVSGRGYRVVVLLAFNHRRFFDRAAILQRPAMRTPLGDIPIDTEITNALLAESASLFAANETLFQNEHSLETQLPFVQVALPEARIVPIMIGADNRSLLHSIASTLFERFGNRRDVLFAVSSDMSHFFAHDEAVRIDRETLDSLLAGRTGQWLALATRQQAGMCGVRPLYTLVSMFEKYPSQARRISLLRYQTSGDTTGDRRRVVGYAALAFSLEDRHRKQVSMNKDFGTWNLEERRALMNIAREAARNATLGQNKRATPPRLTTLQQPGAAFVTLRINGELRGCIGHLIARVPLYSCVDEVARSAAIHDSRFPPIGPEEFERVSFEISILTTPEPVRPEEVTVGTHGLIVSRGPRSGLLLPQVPVEWGWDREQFLAATCRKAGLPADCWKDPQTEIRGFRAIVFDETDV